MKKLYFFVAALLILTSCNKLKEKIIEDQIVKAMTDGQWVITEFTINSSNITSDFTGYKFKYYSNKKVDAILNSTVDRIGDWDGDASNMTTWANFPGAPTPLSHINGTWSITDSGWDYVEATQTAGGNVKTLRLDKQ